MTAELQQRLQATALCDHADALAGIVETAWRRVAAHGDFHRWQEAIDELPEKPGCSIELNRDTVRIGESSDCSDAELACTEAALRRLHPWRKGPFELFGIYIDTEWRSDRKWNRLKDAMTPLSGRTVLDVGCGSGYHSWRMLGAGAAFVVGIDPTPLFAMQFKSIQHFVQDDCVQHWPIGIDDLPAGMACFDTVFSMGILYHRRSPIDHLLQLKDLLKPGGELVLETLVVEGDTTTCLVPEGRYAKMRNVWFIPSVAMLNIWLLRAGFANPRLVDISATTTSEQRATDWMQFESLADFLDPKHPQRTIEGHPAPRRAIMIAGSA